MARPARGSPGSGLLLGALLSTLSFLLLCQRNGLGGCRGRFVDRRGWDSKAPPHRTVSGDLVACTQLLDVSAGYAPADSISKIIPRPDESRKPPSRCAQNVHKWFDRCFSLASLSIACLVSVRTCGASASCLLSKTQSLGLAAIMLTGLASAIWIDRLVGCSPMASKLLVEQRAQVQAGVTRLCDQFVGGDLVQ
jgi:hypothetical protein